MAAKATELQGIKGFLTILAVDFSCQIRLENRLESHIAEKMFATKKILNYDYRMVITKMMIRANLVFRDEIVSDWEAVEVHRLGSFLELLENGRGLLAD